MKFPRFWGSTTKDIPAPQIVTTDLPSSQKRPIKPLIDRPPKSMAKEIFIGLAGTTLSGGPVKNTGEFDPDMNLVPAGFLTYYETVVDGQIQCSRAYFTYSERYDGPCLDPVHLNYVADNTRLFEVPASLKDSGLFRVFSDCVPGQQARKNLNRAYPETKKLNDLQLLTWLASGNGTQASGFSRGFTSGALTFFTKAPGDERPMLNLKSIEKFNAKTVQDLAGLAVRMTDQEIAASIVHGGVRPKTTYFDATGEIGRPNTHYIVKFNNPSQDANNNARVEHGSITLARLAGINTSKTIVVRVLEGGKPVSDMLFIERFDRFTDEEGRDTRQHRLSLLSLMDPKKVRSQDSGDYQDIFNTIRKVSAAPEVDCEEMFRRMLLNIAINNTDDHLKNHEMICSLPNYEWRLSPAYDITPNRDAFPHATSLCGLTNGTLKDDFVLRMSAFLDIEKHLAIKIRDEVATAVSEWVPVFEAAGCQQRDIRYVQEAMNQHGKRAEALLGFGKNLPDPLEQARSTVSEVELNSIRNSMQFEIEVTAPDTPAFVQPKKGPS